MKNYGSIQHDLDLVTKEYVDKFHTPLAVRTYNNLYYGANSTSSGYFCPICVKPKDTTKTIGNYYIKFKVSTTCTGYPNYSNYSIIEYWFNRTGSVNCYKLWNWRVGSYLHYYADAVYGTTNALFNTYGTRIGIGIVSGNYYNSSSYKRTCVFEILDISDDLDYTIEDSCDNLLQYSKMQWYADAVAANGGTALTHTTFNAVDVGLQESGDANIYDRTYMSATSIAVSSQFRLMNYTLAGFDSEGKLFSFGQYNTSSDVTARYASESKGDWVSGTAYVIGDYVRYTNDAYYRCIKAHTSSSSIIPTNSTYWQIYREYNHNGIDYHRGIYYNTSTYARGTVKTNDSLFFAISGVDFRYTFNCVASNSASNTLGVDLSKLVYIRGYIKDDLFYIVPTTVTYSSQPYYKCWTQDPIDESITVDGETYPCCYWLIGSAYYNGSYTTMGFQVNMFPENPMYWFVNGVFEEYKPYIRLSDKASLFSGLSSDTTSPISITIGGTTKSIAQSTLRTSLGLKSAAYTESSAYATSAQGTKADNALPSASFTASNIVSTLGTTPVSKANTLTTARTIWGQSFDGSGNVSGAFSGATTGAFSSDVTIGGKFYLGSTGAYIEWDATNQAFKFSHGIYSTSFVSALGANTDGSGIGTGGGHEMVADWDEYTTDTEMAEYVVSAPLLKNMHDTLSSTTTQFASLDARVENALDYTEEAKTAATNANTALSTIQSQIASMQTGSGVDAAVASKIASNTASINLLSTNLTALTTKVGNGGINIMSETAFDSALADGTLADGIYGVY